MLGKRAQPRLVLTAIVVNNPRFRFHTEPATSVLVIVSCPSYRVHHRSTSSDKLLLLLLRGRPTSRIVFEQRVSELLAERSTNQVGGRRSIIHIVGDASSMTRAGGELLTNHGSGEHSVVRVVYGWSMNRIFFREQ